MRSLAPALALALLLSGCRYQQEKRLSWGLERMLNQQKALAYEASGLFPDGKVMRDPPDGTVPVQRTYLSTSPIATGMLNGAPLREVPFRLTPELLGHGRDRFEIYCAACHGIDGTGVSRVAAAMPLRHPPNLTGDAIRAMPPGQIFRVVSQGFGFMPSYERQLTVEERWAVVAYVKALQLASRVPLAQLPPELREEFDRYVRASRGVQPEDTLQTRPMEGPSLPGSVPPGAESLPGRDSASVQPDTAGEER